MTKLLTNNIPNELTELNQWICWKSVSRKGEVKSTKVPCNPETGFPLAAIKQLYSYSEVCQYAEKYKENVSGIGFYFNGNGISGIDLDNCIDDTGNLSSDARDIINKLNSYTEISPSGKGVHILFRGQLPPGSRNKIPNYEVYSDKRFFTMTGNVFENRDTLATRQSELEWFVEKYVQPKKLSQSDEIINLIRRSRNADKFNRLMSGDTSDYKDNHSDADAGLLSILAFFTKKNRTLMEEIFNQSQLALRDKWKNRQDYRDRTIHYAIENTKEFYAGSYFSENSREIPSQGEQMLAANNILEHFGNPCGVFDTNVLPPLIQRYVNHVCSMTDADPMIVTAAMIGMISGILKKSVYIPEKDSSKAPNECYFDRLYANVYILNVLQSGSFKTTALNLGFKLAYKIEEQARSLNESLNGVSTEQSKLFHPCAPPQNIFLPNKSTPEALLSDLDELDGGVISLSEFGSWLQEMEKSFNIGLKPLFTNFFDVPKRYCVSTKKDKRVYLERPYISIVGVSTIDWVKVSINESDVNTGFFARFLIFNPPVKNTVPPAMPIKRHIEDETIETELFELFLNKVPTTPREYSLSKDAYHRFSEIHNLMYNRLHKLPARSQNILEPYIKGGRHMFLK